MVEEIRAQKSSETALSLTADEVLGNCWMVAFYINFCFGGCVHITRGQTGG
jgi:hypothetical protein